MSQLVNSDRILILANGELPDLEKGRALHHPGDYIICADGGIRHAQMLGITPNLVIGDMDSAEKAQLSELTDAGVEVELYPRDKNETDLELAINKAVDLNPKQLIVAAALGGRMDQTLGNIALLADVRLVDIRMRLDDGVEEILLCREFTRVEGGSGDIVSLIPWGGPAQGVRTENLKWPLRGETLHPDRTRGISNEMLSSVASISIRSGLLLVIHRRLS